MKIITTHRGTDFDAAASVLATKILYPEAVAVPPKRLTDRLVDAVVIDERAETGP